MNWDKIINGKKQSKEKMLIKELMNEANDVNSLYELEARKHLVEALSWKDYNLVYKTLIK